MTECLAWNMMRSIIKPATPSGIGLPNHWTDSESSGVTWLSAIWAKSNAWTTDTHFYEYFHISWHLTIVSFKLAWGIYRFSTFKCSNLSSVIPCRLLLVFLLFKHQKVAQKSCRVVQTSYSLKRSCNQNGGDAASHNAKAASQTSSGMLDNVSVR